MSEIKNNTVVSVDRPNWNKDDNNPVAMLIAETET
jgi:hypothetical protein